jgi:hypothetical protein
MAKQNGPEIHPAVEANHARARQNAEAFSEATQRAVASAGALAEVHKRKQRKKDTLAMLLRVAVAVALSVIIVVLRQFDQVSAGVALVSLMTLEAWAMIWVGAWVQLMWVKEGLLR